MVVTVVKKGQFEVVIRVVKRYSFRWLLLLLALLKEAVMGGY